jgi:hypothetical protein
MDILEGLLKIPQHQIGTVLRGLSKGVLALYNLRVLENTLMPLPLQEEWLKTSLGVEFTNTAQTIS